MAQHQDEKNMLKLVQQLLSQIRKCSANEEKLFNHLNQTKKNPVGKDLILRSLEEYIHHS
jgi:hypothetical protein